MFGPHLTIDLYGCDEETLSSTKNIRNMLNELPGILDMRKIMKPKVMPYAGTPGTFDRGGVTGFVIIATSHISVHTFTYQKAAFIDIFSCKEFDPEKAKEYVTDKFKAKSAEINLIARGKSFVKEVDPVQLDDERSGRGALITLTASLRSGEEKSKISSAVKPPRTLRV